MTTIICVRQKMLLIEKPDFTDKVVSGPKIDNPNNGLVGLMSRRYCIRSVRHVVGFYRPVPFF